MVGTKVVECASLCPKCGSDNVARRHCRVYTLSNRKKASVYRTSGLFASAAIALIWIGSFGLETNIPVLTACGAAAGVVAVPMACYPEFTRKRAEKMKRKRHHKCCDCGFRWEA